VADRATLGAEWNTLLSLSPADTIFLSREWQDLWWQTIGNKSGLEPRTVVVRDGASLIGIAPLLESPTNDSVLRFAGGEEIADFLDIIAAPGREAEVAVAIFDALADHPWRELDLRNLRADAAALTALVPEAERRGYRTEIEQEDVSPWIKLPTSWDAYLEGLTKKDRHELRRKMRRLSSAGEVRWYVASDPTAQGRDVADFTRLMRLSAEAKSEFLTPEMSGWFAAIVERFQPTGQLSLYFLELDGIRLASTICFNYGKRSLLYNSGYDPEYARLSAGLILKAYCIDDAIARGHEVFDFLQGNESYKYDLGAIDAPIYRLRIHRS
jgi:CelD/BcsL family acetyltransferase involved in cellulose biosynthesis